MAIVTAYDRLGFGLDMVDTKSSFVPNSNDLTSDADPSVSQYDYDTYLISQWFNDYQIGFGIYASQYSGNIWTLESLYVFNSDIKPLLAATSVNIRFDITSDFSSGVYFTNLFSGDDVISGNKYSDIIKSGAGNDTLIGNAGNDVLYGESNNDILRGGSGKDTLYGGTGIDYFDFDKITESGINSTTRDVIKDFSKSQGDKIDLRTIDAKAGFTLNDTFSFLSSAPTNNSPSQSSNGKVWYSSGVLYGSTDTDKAAEFSIQVTLSGITTTNASDYILL